MSRPRPPSVNCIQDIMNRLDLLKKIGINDLPINSEEAEAITGLARNTLCRYAILGHFPSFKFPNRNLYPLREMCEWVLKHYHGGSAITTSQINGYQPRVKPGRPRKESKT
jgi:hypothetical protein